MQHGLIKTILLVIFLVIPMFIMIGFLVILDWVFGYTHVSVGS